MEPTPTLETPPDLKERIKDTYDAIAVDYNSWTERSTATRAEFINKLIALLPTGQDRELSVLELGCGSGLPVTKMLVSVPNTKVIANDMSPAQVDLGRKNLAEFEDRVDWKTGDMTQLTFPDGSLDAVVAMYSIIHLPREEQTEMVNKISRWLRPGGHMLVNFTSVADEANINPDWLADKGWMFWSGWGPDHMTKVIKDSGLDLQLSEIRGDPGDSLFFWVLAKK